MSGGICALHVEIVGPIGDAGRDPADVAQAVWDARERRAGHLGRA
jgi:hypothetical protein